MALFDCLHLDEIDLIDLPLHDRRSSLESAVPTDLLVDRVVTADADVASVFFDLTIAAGHEGVVAKAVSSRYEAGRRGGSWMKVKPTHTLDLVVLAAEWGHGRRTGHLSNLRLGARGPDGGFVMLGKTFKGLTDKVLAWQTDCLLRLEKGRRGNVVRVRPELVVEIAFDGIQTSAHYPGRGFASVRLGQGLSAGQEGRGGGHARFGPRRRPERLREPPIPRLPRHRAGDGVRNRHLRCGMAHSLSPRNATPRGPLPDSRRSTWIEVG